MKDEKDKNNARGKLLKALETNRHEDLIRQEFEKAFTKDDKLMKLFEERMKEREKESDKNKGRNNF